MNTFKYLGATLAGHGDLDAEMTHRIQSGWKHWKRVSGSLCDRRISLRVMGKVYKTATSCVNEMLSSFKLKSRSQLR